MSYQRKNSQKITPQKITPQKITRQKISNMLKNINKYCFDSKNIQRIRFTIKNRRTYINQI